MSGIDRRSVMLGTAVAVAVPSLAQASVPTKTWIDILKSPYYNGIYKGTTSTIIKACDEDLDLCGQMSNRTIKALIPILDDQNASDAEKIKAAYVILNHNNRTVVLAGPYVWRKLYELVK